MKKNRLLILIAGCFFLLSSCGGDEPVTPTPTPTNKDSVTEFLIINGKRFEGKDFVKKSLQRTNSTTYLNIYLDKGLFPIVSLEHERVADSLLPRKYDISTWVNTSFEFDQFEVAIQYSEGPPPAWCQFLTKDNPPTPHGKYELKRVGTKLVSEFGNAFMTCVDGGDGKATANVEGVVVWEEK